MSIYSEFHVEFNGHSPMNRNDPQQVENFGPGSLKNCYVTTAPQFTSVLSLCALEIVLGLASMNALRWFLRGDSHYFGETMMLFSA